MKYSLRQGVVSKIKTIQQRTINITAAALLLATSVSGAAPLFLATAHAATDSVVNLDSGEWFTGIQTAIDDPDTDAGDTIRVGQATYTGQITVDKDLTIRGDNATLTGAGPKFHVTASGVTIKNLTFSNITGSGYNGVITVDGHGVNNLMVKNNVFTNISESAVGYHGNKASFNSGLGRGIVVRDNTITKVSGSNQYAIWLGNTYKAQVINNTIDTATRGGVFVDGGHRARIRDNTISNMAVYGLNFSYDGYSIPLDGVYATNNAVTNSGTSDVVALGSNISLRHNSFDTSNAAGLKNYGPQVNARYNYWGDASGPQTADNSTASGSAISGDVRYFPWYTDTSYSQVATSLSDFMTSQLYVKAHHAGYTAAKIHVPQVADSVKVTFTDQNGVKTKVDGVEHTQGAQWPRDGLSEYRAGADLAPGKYDVSAYYVVDNHRYTVNGSATVYAVTSPVANYVTPNSQKHYFRPGDNPVRVRANDTFNQFDNMKVVIKDRFGNPVSTYNVDRNDCDLRAAGNYVLCDVDQASNWSDLNADTYMATTTVYNQARNHTEITSRLFTVDDTAPVMSYADITSPSGSVYSDSVTITQKVHETNVMNGVKFYFTAPRADGMCDPNQPKLLGPIDATPTHNWGGYWFYQTQVDTSSLNGKYCIFSVAEDAAMSHSNPQEHKFSATFDNKAPAAPTNLLVNGQATPFFTQTDNRFTRTWAASTSDDVDHYVYKSFTSLAKANNPDGSGWTKDIPTVSGQSTYSLSGTTNHTFWWRVAAVDAAGNTTWSDVYNVVVDDDAPNVTLKTNASKPFNDLLNLEFTVDDGNGSGVPSPRDGNKGVYFKLVNANGDVVSIRKSTSLTTLWMVNNNGVWTSRYGAFDTNNLPDGTYTIIGRAIDNAGNTAFFNQSHNSILGTIKIDNTEPTLVSAHMYVNGQEVNTVKPGDTVTVTATFTDNNGAGVDHNTQVEYWVHNFASGQRSADYIGSGLKMVWNSSSQQWEATFTVPSNGNYSSGNPFNETMDGNYINFRATDNIGNSKSHGNIKFTIDATAPVAAITSPTIDQVVKGTSLDVTGTATDANFDHYTLELQDNKHVTLNSATVNFPVDSDLLGTWDISGLKNGSYYLVLTVFDKPGNTPTSVTQHFTINNGGEANQHASHPASSTPPTFTPPAAPQVLGASVTDGSTTGSDSSDKDSKSGKVEGASDVKQIKTVANTTDDAKDTGAWLGLGWWWLAVLAVLLGFFAFLFRRANNTKTA